METLSILVDLILTWTTYYNLNNVSLWQILYYKWLITSSQLAREATIIWIHTDWLEWRLIQWSPVDRPTWVWECLPGISKTFVSVSHVHLLQKLDFFTIYIYVLSCFIIIGSIVNSRSSLEAVHTLYCQGISQSSVLRQTLFKKAVRTFKARCLSLCWWR